MTWILSKNFSNAFDNFYIEGEIAHMEDNINQELGVSL